MSVYEILALAGLVAAIAGAIHILMNKDPIGSPILAAALSAGFAAYTIGTIMTEGVALVWLNHTTNMWGVQVWWDLLICVVVGLFLVAPRARAVGMNVPLWTLFVAATASIGLLAMVGRVFWLERRTA
ncbi:MAG: hypothetical protein ABJ239_09840 [Erythrobacter sp.]